MVKIKYKYRSAKKDLDVALQKLRDLAAFDEASRIFNAIRRGYKAIPSVTIGAFRIVQVGGGKVSILRLNKKGYFIDSGHFSEKKFAKMIGQFYSDNF